MSWRKVGGGWLPIDFEFLGPPSSILGRPGLLHGAGEAGLSCHLTVCFWGCVFSGGVTKPPPEVVCPGPGRASPRQSTASPAGNRGRPAGRRSHAPGTQGPFDTVSVTPVHSGFTEGTLFTAQTWRTPLQHSRAAEPEPGSRT